MKDIKRELGHQLAMARLEKHFDLQYVAKAVQLKPEQIEHIELGHRTANWKKYDKLLKLYGKKVKLRLVDA